MKTIKLLAFGVLAILLSCCDESRIYMKYHFFTKSELDNLYINVDSVVVFQESLSKYITYEEFKAKQQFYVEIDTALFLLDNTDTIACRYDNNVLVNSNSDEFVVNPDTKSIANISLTPLRSSFFKNITYRIHKPSELKEDNLSQQIVFSYSGFTSPEYDVYLYKSGVVSQNNTYFIASREAFTLNNIHIDDCLVVKFYDTSSIEKVIVIYSSKYGFLKLKNTQHEITRIL